MDLEGWKMKPNINHNIETDLQNKPHIEETILTETRAYNKYSAEEKTELNRSSKKIDFNKDRTPRDSKYSQRTDDRTSNNRSLTKYKYKIKSEKPEKRKQRHYSSSSND